MLKASQLNPTALRCFSSRHFQQLKTGTSRVTDLLNRGLLIEVKVKKGKGVQDLVKGLLGAMLALVPLQFSGAASAAQLFGWEEQVLLLPDKIELKAQLDTSSDGSSLVVANIVPFDKEGEKWVHFTVQVPKGMTGSMTEFPFELKILRSEKGKALIGSGGRRQVVKMSLCIGNQVFQEELTLKTKGKKDYLLTLGRSTLQHLGAVDARLTNTIKPDCSVSSAKPAG